MDNIDIVKLMEETINEMAALMHIAGTLEEKCQKIKIIYKQVGAMMPDAKTIMEKAMLDIQGGKGIPDIATILEGMQKK